MVQSFYGLDKLRIKATTRALNHLLQSNFLPSTWVFVESQYDEKDAKFNWLCDKGVKYVFQKMTHEQDGLMLKPALWNIGTLNCSEDNLVFLDSDVMFERSDWLMNINDAFSEFRIFSPHSFSIDERTSKPHESIGSTNMTIGRCCGHPGYGICLTRELFNQIHGF